MELPDEVDQRLSQKAAETGTDAVHLIRVAVGRFVDEQDVFANSGNWSVNAEERRRALIDKDIVGAVTHDEQVELAQLDRLANEHFDRVTPPPLERARRLHEELLKKRGN